MSPSPGPCPYFFETLAGPLPRGDAPDAVKLDPTPALSLFGTGEPSSLLEWRKADAPPRGASTAPGRRTVAKQPKQSTQVSATQGSKASSNAPASERGAGAHMGTGEPGIRGGVACPNRLTSVNKTFLENYAQENTCLQRR